jgi:nucleotide-binding universal stress UspA family protein
VVTASRAIRSFGLPVDRIRHLTTGGEAALEMLAGHALPAIAALDNEVNLVAPIDLRPHRILLPVDGSEHSLETARRIGLLANAEGAEITLLYVQELKAFMVGQTTEPQMKRQREIEREFEAERVFASAGAALARQGLIAHQQLAVEGNPAEEILKFAEEVRADLIAMGSHGKTGALRFLMGSVSRKVLDHAKCPVLIVRLPDTEMVKAGLIEA